VSNEVVKWKCLSVLHSSGKKGYLFKSGMVTFSVTSWTKK